MNKVKLIYDFFRLWIKWGDRKEAWEDSKFINDKRMQKELDDIIAEEDLWCEYSDLPSPLSYTKCMDYDSMGNYGRYPKSKTKKEKLLKTVFKKIIGGFKIW